MCEFNLEKQPGFFKCTPKYWVGLTQKNSPNFQAGFFLCQLLCVLCLWRIHDKFIWSKIKQNPGDSVKRQRSFVIRISRPSVAFRGSNGFAKSSYRSVYYTGRTIYEDKIKWNNNNNNYYCCYDRVSCNFTHRPTGRCFQSVFHDQKRTRYYGSLDSTKTTTVEGTLL